MYYKQEPTYNTEPVGEPLMKHMILEYRQREIATNYIEQRFEHIMLYIVGQLIFLLDQRSASLV